MSSAEQVQRKELDIMHGYDYGKRILEQNENIF